MLRSLRTLCDFWIHAADGDLGAVHDFYVDDRDWTVRHVVVDTGNWLPGRKVVLSPAAISYDNWRDRHLHVRMTKDEVRNNPAMDAGEPVTRQIAERVKRYLRLPASLPDFEREFEALTPPTTPDADPPREVIDDEHPHLHGLRELLRLHARASDGPIGPVRDLLCDDDDWRIRYLVVGEDDVAPGRETTVSPRWIDAIDWPAGELHLNLRCDQVRTSPPYHHPLVDPEYESQLVSHYGRSP